MFDTHCHLSSEEYENNLPSVINSAREKGVKKFLIPSVNLDDAKKALGVTESYEGVYMAVGVHPTEDLEKLNLDETLYKIEDYFSESRRVVAIGEIGLDYYRYKSGASVQKEFFKAQVKLAIKKGVASIVHNRHATKDLLKCLVEIGEENLRGRMVFHCCPPEDELLEFAIANTIYIGVDGDVTYDTQKQDFIKKVPLNLLVLETDSPYLLPEPARSEKRFPNVPGNLEIILEKTQELRQENSISETTYLNSKKLFNL